MKKKENKIVKLAIFLSKLGLFKPCACDPEGPMPVTAR